MKNPALSALSVGAALVCAVVPLSQSVHAAQWSTRLALRLRTPDVQQSFLIAGGTTGFNQQRDAVPALLGAPGLT